MRAIVASTRASRTPRAASCRRTMRRRAERVSGAGGIAINLRVGTGSGEWYPTVAELRLRSAEYHSPLPASSVQRLVESPHGQRDQGYGEAAQDHHLRPDRVQAHALEQNAAQHLEIVRERQQEAEPLE